MAEPRRQAETILGWAVYGAVAAGVLALVGAVLTFLTGERSGSALFLIAAGVAFGQLAGALLRR